MILTLPISHLINSENYLQVPGVEALEFKKRQPMKSSTYLIIEFYKDFSELIEIYKEVDEWLKNGNKN